MEDVRVLAIASVPQRAKDGQPLNAIIATVEVTPEEAERLAIATRQGWIQLMLRGKEATDPPPPAVSQTDSLTIRR